MARKRLRDIVVEKQREAEGIISPAKIRDAASIPLVELITSYRTNLVGRGLEPGHIRDTVGRLIRMTRDTGWVRLQDVTPSTYEQWRGACRWAAKTQKEYQTSIRAFLNWLVRSDRLLVNPLGKIDPVVTKGKSVRESRALTLVEVTRLAATAPSNRRLVYLFLAYTGARKNEARTLRWCDVTLGEKPQVLLRVENTKTDRKRVVPLRRELAGLLGAELEKLAALKPDGLVFDPFPSDDALHADLKRAGIERKNTIGRIVHFHAFRKTFQTWGAVHGVGQRSAQELLGHSDPSLTANVYTDISSLELHGEVAKIPWIADAQPTHSRR